MDKKSCVRETQEKRRKSSRYIVVGNSQQKKQSTNTLWEKPRKNKGTNLWENPRQKKEYQREYKDDECNWMEYKAIG